MPFRISRTAAATLLLALASTAPHAAQRAFVSSTGNDGNVGVGCTLLAQCRSFQAAHEAVDSGGEIVALDTAGYGPVNISKSVTITANPGVVAGISTSTGDAVKITTPGVDVTLRRLTLNDVGASNHGVYLSAGSSLVLDGVVISRFGYGVRVIGSTRVKVVDSLLEGNTVGISFVDGPTVELAGLRVFGTGASFGVHAGGSGGSVTTVAASDTLASGNASGFIAIATAAETTVRVSCIRCVATNNVENGFRVMAIPGSFAVMSVSASKATFNGLHGLSNGGGGGMSDLRTTGDNFVDQNGSGATLGTISPLAPI